MTTKTMEILLIVLVSILLCMSGKSMSHGTEYHDYIIIGAGPAGLQMGYFLERAGREYVILERASVAGNFYTVYPRHDQLISINKRHTGKANIEFNLRHDWNSLISTYDRRNQPDDATTDDDEKLIRFGTYSRQMFPHRNTMLRYLNDFAANASLRIRYETVVHNISRLADDDRTLTTSKRIERFKMHDQHGNIFYCHTLLVATGMWKPNVPAIEGEEFIEGYETVSTDPDNFEGQSVLILGRGNSAFELARSIYGATSLVHMMGRSRVRLSWATHYVGDLRAVNNELLDTYQLKSLDGIFESSTEETAIRKRNGKLYLEVRDYSANESHSATAVDRATSGNESHSGFRDNLANREPYDRIIRCLGFRFDDSIFSKDMPILRPEGRQSKYPKIDYGYESVDYPGLHFVGTVTHSLDFRKSAGGFIHGFRYTARALHRLLEWRNHGLVWPTVSGSVIDLVTTVVKRINEASGIYQMYRMLGDVILLRGASFEYIEEFPLNLLHELPQRTGLRFTTEKSTDGGNSHSQTPVDGILVVSLEYGSEFSGPNHDVFHEDRATGDPSSAHESNFLHPVFYYYKTLPTVAAMNDRRPPWDILPRPDRIHHTVEDFLTTWDAPNSHILPMRRFIESTIEGATGRDLRSFFADTCMIAALTHQSLPLSCSEQYMFGSGLERPSTETSLLPTAANVNYNTPGTIITDGSDEMHEPSTAKTPVSQLIGASSA